MELERAKEIIGNIKAYTTTQQKVACDLISSHVGCCETELARLTNMVERHNTEVAELLKARPIPKKRGVFYFKNEDMNRFINNLSLTSRLSKYEFQRFAEDLEKGGDCDAEIKNKLKIASIHWRK